MIFDPVAVVAPVGQTRDEDDHENNRCCDESCQVNRCAVRRGGYLTKLSKEVPREMPDGWKGMSSIVDNLGLALGAFFSGSPDVGMVADDSPLSSLQALVIPFLPILLALGMLAVEVAVGRKLYHSDWHIAVAPTLLVLVRQCFMLS